MLLLFLRIARLQLFLYCVAQRLVRDLLAASTPLSAKFSLIRRSCIRPKCAVSRGQCQLRSGYFCFSCGVWLQMDGHAKFSLQATWPIHTIPDSQRVAGSSVSSAFCAVQCNECGNPAPHELTEGLDFFCWDCRRHNVFLYVFSRKFFVQMGIPRYVLACILLSFLLLQISSLQAAPTGNVTFLSDYVPSPSARLKKKIWPGNDWICCLSMVLGGGWVWRKDCVLGAPLCTTFCQTSMPTPLSNGVYNW